MPSLPPPALIAPAPPSPTALVEVSSDGKVTLNWDLIRQVAAKSKADAGDDVVWTMARALLEAHNESVDVGAIACTMAGITKDCAIPSGWGALRGGMPVPGYSERIISNPVDLTRIPPSQ